MKIGELAKRSGLSAYTIRYYERIGLLPYADRDRSSRRDYDPDILVWIEFLGRLKNDRNADQGYAALCRFAKAGWCYRA